MIYGRDFNFFGSIPRGLLRKSYSQTPQSLSFPNASIGNPDETMTGPPIKTFGGDDLDKFSAMFLLSLYRDQTCCPRPEGSLGSSSTDEFL